MISNVVVDDGCGCEKVIDNPIVTNGKFWRLDGNEVTEDDFLGSKNNESIRFKTNNIQQVVFHKNGKNGFGVEQPTNEVDTQSIRNRGEYRDQYNQAGISYEKLISFEGKTKWIRDDSHLNATPYKIGETVEMGICKDFIVMPYGQYLRYNLEGVAVSVFEPTVSQNLCKTVFYVKRVETGVVDYITENYFATQEHFRNTLTQFTVNAGDIIFCEIINLYGAKPKGLGFTITFNPLP
jgi:hypothetical protein